MSQYFEQALESKLGSINSVAALVNGAIYVGFIPQTHDLGAQGPAIAYSLPSRNMGHVLTGSDGTAKATVALRIQSYSYGTTKQILDGIRSAMDGPPSATWGDGSVTILSVVQTDDVDNPIPPQAGTDQPIFEAETEYDIQYRVSIPST